jgi:hypothetical protein
MPRTTMRAYYDIGAGEVEITNVLDITCNIGRQAQLNAYRANTAEINIRYPSGYASPNAAFVPGTEIRITTDQPDTPGMGRQVFRGEIADVKVTYDKPYASSTGPGDILTLTCESYFATMGRTEGLGFALTAQTLNTQLGYVQTQFNTATLASVTGFGDTTSFPATTLNNTVADYLNLVALTMNGRIHDAGPSVGLIIFNQYYKPASVYGNFSDDGTESSKYTEITFDSLADNYYTQITVDPESYAQQTVQTGSAPYRSYLVNTLNASTGQALDYANYLLSTYKDPQLAISSFRVFLNDTTTNPTFGCTGLGTAIYVKFRGTTYNCIIEGATFSGTPDGGVYVTYYVSGEDLNNYLLLDNAVYGKLDNNKLGY